MSKLRFRKRKGGSSFFSDIIGSVSSLGFMFMILFVSTLILFFTQAGLDVTIYGNLIHGSTYNENILTGYMDLTTDVNGKNYKMSDLLAYAVWNGNESFELNGAMVDITDQVDMNSYYSATHRLTLDIQEGSILLSEMRGENFGIETTAMIYAGDKVGILKLEG